MCEIEIVAGEVEGEGLGVKVVVSSTSGSSPVLLQDYIPQINLLALKLQAGSERSIRLAINRASGNLHVPNAAEVVESTGQVRFSIHASRYGIVNAGQTLEFVEVRVLYANAGLYARTGIDLTFPQAEAARASELLSSALEHHVPRRD